MERVFGMKISKKTCKNIGFSVLLQSLQAIACVFYYMSLKRNDIEDIKSNIWTLVLCIFTCQIISLITVFLSYRLVRKKIRIFNWALQVLQILVALVHDLGVSVEYHGLYNLLAFVLLLVFISLVSSLFMTCKILKSTVDNNQM